MIGQYVNNYVIRSLVGEGGMGAVWLAEHPVIGRRVVVKVLKKEFCDDEGNVARFVNEARAAHATHHPNIVDVLDAGTLASGVPYIMMELLEGETLGRRLERERRLRVADAVEIALQTAQALHAAHSVGIVHRDLKPDNLFLVADPIRPGHERVKVLDFGIAKLRKGLGNSLHTSTGAVMGTPIYMSPEQCRGVGAIDRRSDVYSLGIIFYEMLCGEPPFHSEGPGDVLLMHMSQEPERPALRNPAVPPAIEAVILKALAKQPDDRFADMDELRVAVGSEGARTLLLQQPPAGSGGTPPPTEWPPAAAPAPPADRRRLFRRLAATAVGMAAAIGAASAWRSRTPRAHPAASVAPLSDPGPVAPSRPPPEELRPASKDLPRDEAAPPPPAREEAPAEPKAERARKRAAHQIVLRAAPEVASPPAPPPAPSGPPQKRGKKW